MRGALSKRILMTLRGSDEHHEGFQKIVERAAAKRRSINTQVLCELGLITEDEANAIPLRGRRAKSINLGSQSSDF